MVRWEASDWADEMWYATGRDRPTGRGVLHACAVIWSPLWCLHLLAQCKSSMQWLGAVLFLFSSVWLFTGSALYHRYKWTVNQEVISAKLDYLGIFLMIAFSLGPAYTLLLPPALGMTVISMLALTVLAGVWLIMSDVAVSRVQITLTFVAQGAIQCIPLFTTLLSEQSIVSQLHAGEIRSLVAIGSLYLVGAVVYSSQRPNPIPKAFGFHEIWHSIIVAAAALTYSLNFSIISRRLTFYHHLALQGTPTSPF